jgi:hypothetical protein
MTLPHESDRAVKQTREFLVRLSSPYGDGAIKGVRREVRAEALALLRHYALSWNGDCPERDNAANSDNAEVRRLRAAITALADQDATLAVCDGAVTVTMDCPGLSQKNLTLTDDERVAIAGAADLIDALACGDSATLRGLLDRLSPLAT